MVKKKVVLCHHFSCVLHDANLWKRWLYLPQNTSLFTTCCFLYQYMFTCVPSLPDISQILVGMYGVILLLTEPNLSSSPAESTSPRYWLSYQHGFAKLPFCADSCKMQTNFSPDRLWILCSQGAQGCSVHTALLTVVEQQSINNVYHRTSIHSMQAN